MLERWLEWRVSEELIYRSEEKAIRRSHTAALMSNLERATSAKFSKLPEFECVKLGRAKTHRDVLSSPVFSLCLWEEVERGGWVGAGVRHKLSARHGRRTEPRMKLKFYFKKVGMVSLCDDAACGAASGRVRTYVTPPHPRHVAKGGVLSCPDLLWLRFSPKHQRVLIKFRHKNNEFQDVNSRSLMPKGNFCSR